MRYLLIGQTRYSEQVCAHSVGSVLHGTLSASACEADNPESDADIITVELPESYYGTSPKILIKGNLVICSNQK